MTLLVRYRTSAVLVLVAVAAVGGLFTVARARVETGGGDSQMIQLAEQAHVSVAAVRDAFAAEGIVLRYSTTAPVVTILSTSPPGQWTSEKLFVHVGGRTGQIDFGARSTEYDERFENILVTYGGDDESLLRRIELSVEALDG
jgi:hypothetical protein